jgi:hypothetical protein
VTNEPRPDLAPTSGMLRVFTAYVRAGSQKAAAQECGVAVQTVKSQLGELYTRLDVGSAMEAAAKLGWLHVPEDTRPACGWVGYCSRPLGHRGHHGGMRSALGERGG